MTVHAQDGTEHLLVAPRSMTNSATASANFDTLGAAYATIRVAFSSEINTNAVGPTISLLHSDDTVVSNFATITADRTAEAIVNAKALVYHVDCKTRKRYLRLTINTGTATNDDVRVSATGTLTRKSESPGSTTAMAGSTNDVVLVV